MKPISVAYRGTYSRVEGCGLELQDMKHRYSGLSQPILTNTLSNLTPDFYVTPLPHHLASKHSTEGYFEKVNQIMSFPHSKSSKGFRLTQTKTQPARGIL